METSPHILVVDDDREIRDLLAKFLTKHGYRVTTARDGEEMFKALDGWRIDLVVLDLMLPGEDGLSLCRRLRAHAKTPVIMLTAMGEETDRIIGLEMGADDYMPKPFNPRELLARIKAVLRRAQSLPETQVERSPAIRFAGWTLDVATRRLESPEGVVVDLSSGEHDMLMAFLDHPRRVLSRDQLLDLARNRSSTPFDRSIDVHIGHLRRKIEANPRDPQLIKTVHGVGYMFATVVERG